MSLEACPRAPVGTTLLGLLDYCNSLLLDFSALYPAVASVVRRPDAFRRRWRLDEERRRTQRGKIGRGSSWKRTATAPSTEWATSVSRSSQVRASFSLIPRPLKRSYPNILITFRVSRIDNAKCILVTRVSVCLSAAACPYYCTDQDVTSRAAVGAP